MIRIQFDVEALAVSVGLSKVSRLFGLVCVFLFHHLSLFNTIIIFYYFSFRLTYILKTASLWNKYLLETQHYTGTFRPVFFLFECVCVCVCVCVCDIFLLWRLHCNTSCAISEAQVAYSVHDAPRY